MYPIPGPALDLLNNNYAQGVEITFSGTEQNLTIIQDDITQGGLVISRYCVSGDKIELGSVVASELALSLNNAENAFEGVMFEGAELYVRLILHKWDAHEWENAPYYYIPMGYFTIDEAPRKLETINLRALDRMALFDKEADLNLLSFPMTVSTLITRICSICNVTLYTSPSSLLNASYVIQNAPKGDNLTYRQLLSWACEITASCAYMDWNGRLVLKWYNSSYNVTLTPSNRYESDIKEKAITITGVQIKDGDNVYLEGTDDYAFNIEGNALIQDDFYSLLDTLYGRLGGFSYTPYSATVFPMPYLYPLDTVSFVDKNNTAHFSIVSNITYTLNMNTILEGRGETATNSGYASSNPLTNRESVIINQLQREQNKTLNNRIQNVLAFNELISNALGMYMTQRELLDGSTVFYMHNLPTLEESRIIFTLTSEGIAWTASGWNSGEPIWTYGVSSAGDALFRKLSAEGIDVGSVNEDYRVEITPSAFNVYYRENLVTSIVGDTMKIPRVNISEFIEIGNIRIIPYKVNNEIKGANFIYVG